jgi:hypothetical protein
MDRAMEQLYYLLIFLVVGGSLYWILPDVKNPLLVVWGWVRGRVKHVREWVEGRASRQVTTDLERMLEEIEQVLPRQAQAVRLGEARLVVQEPPVRVGIPTPVWTPPPPPVYPTCTLEERLAALKLGADDIFNATPPHLLRVSQGAGTAQFHLQAFDRPAWPVHIRMLQIRAFVDGQPWFECEAGERSNGIPCFVRLTPKQLALVSLDQDGFSVRLNIRRQLWDWQGDYEDPEGQVGVVLTLPGRVV